MPGPWAETNMDRAVLFETVRNAKRNAVFAETALKRQASTAAMLCVDANEAEAMLARWRQVWALRAAELDRLQAELDSKCVHP